jgi:hypothetical protein
MNAIRSYRVYLGNVEGLLSPSRNNLRFMKNLFSPSIQSPGRLIPLLILIAHESRAYVFSFRINEFKL